MAQPAPLPQEQQASYTIIIDGILATADLNTISAKKIREGLQKAVQYDISGQKEAIKALIMQRFDKFHAEQEKMAAAAVPAVEEIASPEPAVNGNEETSSASPTASKRKADSEEFDTGSAPSASPAPPKKKARKTEEMDADAVLAAKLQAEENARSRSTRGGNSRKVAPAPKKKAKKKSKSKSKVNADDDSDVDGSAKEERKVNRNSGFHKPLILSPALSELMGGEIKLSRPQATKKLWAYIKANDLQDPSDKRMIRCDDALRAVFKTDTIGMFKMTKSMNQNMYNEGE